MSSRSPVNWLVVALLVLVIFSPCLCCFAGALLPEVPVVEQ